MFNGRTLAAAIRQRRLQLNYTQEYIAYKLNMSQNAYSKVELGFTALTVERFVQLCEVMEMDMRDALQPALCVA